MQERCVDASVAIKWVVPTEADRDQALALLAESQTAGIRLISPPLFPTEVDSYIRQRVHNGTFTEEEAELAYAALDSAPIVILDPPGLRQRTREIAIRFNQRLMYDSLYAALADLRKCELWTADTRFYRVVKDDLPFVKHIANFALP